MTYGIDGLSGFGSYGVGGYMPNRKEDVNKEAVPEQVQEPVNNYEDAKVDPAKVMDFLASNNFFVAAPTATGGVAEIDNATRDRVTGYMEQFEMIYGVVVEEFGEEIAPSVMDVVMDSLMGMVA